ncbi:MAG TPA: ferritin family protein [Thermomicrobiaceae bacterium]|nr:ferritin family protein [Thermomicrobiaceae bacterium]
MDSETRTDLMTAMRGEAFAYAKYLLFAAQARRQGLPEVADLFERTAQVEYLEHFAEEAELYGLVSDVAGNLRDAIVGEAVEVETMYRAFAEHAAAVGDQAAAARFVEIRDDEAAHQQAFEEALQQVEAEPVHA